MPTELILISSLFTAANFINAFRYSDQASSLAFLQNYIAPPTVQI